MPDDTTPADEPQENWQQRYTGLQKVVAQRDTVLTARERELDVLRAEKEAADTELAEFRQAKADASEAEAARLQYESLRERFESEQEPPPTPVGNGGARQWYDPPIYEPGKGQRQALPDSAPANDRSSGWPT